MGTWVNIGYAKDIVDISRTVTDIGLAALGTSQPPRISRFKLRDATEVSGVLLECRFGNNGGANGIWQFEGDAVIDEAGHRTYVDYADVIAVDPLPAPT